MNPVILLTFDVEDWFQVENLRECFPYSSWPSCELRVERNTYRLLDLLDSMELKHTEDEDKNISSSSESPDLYPPTSDLQPPTNGLKPQAKRSSSETALQPQTPKATFFVLGWIAERLPNLVREIHARGHEVASHGYGHRLCSECSLEDLRSDLLDSKKLLEDILGNAVFGYRAPNFSVNDDILRLIEECGYRYDSSYNSFAMNKRYGKLTLNNNHKTGIAYKIPSGKAAFDKIGKRFYFFELPISNLIFNLESLILNLEFLTLPWGGGGYFRLIPSFLFKLGVRSILKRNNGYIFYMHPWEVDPQQPRAEGVSRFSRFRHYVNLAKAAEKLKRLMTEFAECRFLACRQYLDTLDE